MNISQAQTKQNIPDHIKKKLNGLSIEKQLEYFSLEHCHTTTVWIDEKISNLEKYHGKKLDIGKDTTILVQDNIIIGVDIGEALYCFTKPYSSIHSYNGHRTTSDGWGYEEEHEWFVFRYLGSDT